MVKIMAIKFPKDWDKKRSNPCSICMRDSVANPDPDGTIPYYGGVGKKVCSECGRFCCPIHYSFPEKLCLDCSTKKEKDDDE